ncbi:MAG: NUDIX domain-containing protein [Caulobacteraceae bacterium]|nr:NUDIX domain-containing protein [Caulobacteraceae bacterium]
MSGFWDSYLGRLRREVGDRLILMPGARIVIEDGQGRILLQERADFGVWGLPGGHAEEGEDLTDMIVRETLEETGLIIASPTPYGFSSDPAHETIVYPNGHVVHSFAMMFFIRDFEGVARVADDESTAIAWHALDALPELMPSNRRSIEAYPRFKQTGAFQMI